MWIFLTLGMVVLAHLAAIGFVMMALAAAAGVVLYLTRPEAAHREAVKASSQKAAPAAVQVPRQIGERRPMAPVSFRTSNENSQRGAA